MFFSNLTGFSFLKYMAPYIIHFDPALQTYDYVQRHSAFLLATILSASAKIFNPDLHRKLHQHSEALLAKAFISGEKSIEIVKAILMLTYWKEPDDTRVWQLVGYACRMCVELRGRRTHTRNTDPKSAVVDLIKLRERRNVERIWLTLFVYDRRYAISHTYAQKFLTHSPSISLQLGKQWMLHIDHLTRRVDLWYQHELVIPSGDAILASFVELRVLSSDLLDVLDIDSSSSNQQQHEMLLNMFNTDLDKWESKWGDVFNKCMSNNPDYAHGPNLIPDSVSRTLPPVLVSILRAAYKIIHQLFATADHVGSYDGSGQAFIMALLHQCLRDATSDCGHLGTCTITLLRTRFNTCYDRIRSCIPSQGMNSIPQPFPLR